MRIQLVYDTDWDVPDEGSQYFHCQVCIRERPDDQSPKEWARQQVAIRTDGKLQVRCTRHDLNIAVITPRIAEKVR